MFLLVVFAVIVNAELHVNKVTKQCENKIALTTQNLKTPLTKLQGLTFFTTDAEGTKLATETWYPACSSPYPLLKGKAQVQCNNLGVCTCLAPPTGEGEVRQAEGATPFNTQINQLSTKSAANSAVAPKDVACCDKDMMPGLNQEIVALRRQIGALKSNVFQKRWDPLSLNAFKSACEFQEGTLYFMSSIGRKVSGEITYSQTFRDTNVICIPDVCSTTDKVNIMEVRAAECQKNYLSSCDFAIRAVDFEGKPEASLQALNLDSFSVNNFGYTKIDEVDTFFPRDKSVAWAAVGLADESGVSGFFTTE